MSEFLQNLQVSIPAFAMCLVLTGIHAYLGLHVLERKVIFVDLALAQIAALGGIFAMWLGYDMHAEPEAHVQHTLLLFQWLGLDWAAPPDELVVYGFSLAFALGGAAVFALTRMRHERVPQEAFIGVTFATAVSLALLLLSRLGGSAEHVRNMLASDALMLARWSDVLNTAILYVVLGVVHYACRRPFFRISVDPEGAMAAGMRVRWWDFLFYATFGFVITKSVAIAGVLLVFSYLVVPGAIATLFADRVGTRIWVAWGAGFLASVLGIMACAWNGGTPPGPWIVTAFAAMLLASGLLRAWRGSAERGRALRRFACCAVLLGVIGMLAMSMRKESVHDPNEDPIREALETGDPAAQQAALHEIASLRDAHYVAAVADLLDRNPPATVTEHAVETLDELGDPSALPVLHRTAARDLDPELRLRVAEVIAHMGDAGALGIMLAIVDSDAPGFSRHAAADTVSELTGREVDPDDASTVAAFRAWLDENRDSLRYNAAARRFE